MIISLVKAYKFFNLFFLILFSFRQKKIYTF